MISSPAAGPNAMAYATARFSSTMGAGVAGRDGRLERVRAQGAGELLGPFERREAATDEEPVPARAILIEQQDRLPRRTDPRLEARCLDLHQRHEAVDIRVAGLDRKSVV